MAAEQDLNRLVERLDKISDLLQGVAGEFDATTTRIDDFAKEGEKGAKKVQNSFTNAVKEMAVAGKLLRQSITVIPDTLTKSFQGSFKTIGQFQNEIYLASRRLGEMNRNLRDIGRTQQMYRDQIEQITRTTYLSRQESKALFDALNSGFTGLKTEGAIKQMTDIATNIGRLTTNAQEAQKMLQGLNQSYLQYQQFRNIARGGGSAADFQLAGLFKQTNLASRDSYYDLMALNRSARSNSGGGTGRETQIQEAARTQAAANRDFAEDEAVTQEKLAQGYVNLGTQMNRFGESMASVTSKFEMLAQLTGDLSYMISSVTGAAGAVSSTGGALGGLFGQRGIGGFAGTAGALAGGAIGGRAAYLSGEATPVYVVNMPGGGFGGFPGAPVTGGARSAFAKTIRGGGLQMGTLAGALGLSGWKSMPGYGSSGFTAAELRAAGAGQGLTKGALVRNAYTNRMVGGVKGLGGRIPVIGGVIAGGMEAFSDNYEGVGNRAAAGAVTGGSTMAATALGAAIGTAILPGIGTAIGAAIFGMGGAAGGSALSRMLFGKDNDQGSIEESNKLNSTAAERVQRAREIAKYERESAEALREASTESGEFESQIEEVTVQMGAMAVAAEKVAASVGSAVSQMSQFPGLADQTAGAMQYQASLMGEQIAYLAEQERLYAQNYQNAVATGDEEAARVAKMRYAEAQGKRISKYYEQQALLVESIKKPFEDRIKLQKINVGLADAELKRNEALRMGIGVSYKDTIRTVAAKAEQVKLEKALANDLAKKARLADDPAVRKQLEMEAAQAQQRALETETSMLEDAKSMREGYLDSLEETVAGLGAFAKILPKQGQGNQFFADTPSLGRVADSAESAAKAVQDPTRYTMMGPQITDEIVEGHTRGLEEFTKYGDAFIWKLGQAIDQAYGPMGAGGGAILGSQQIDMATLGSAGMPNNPGGFPTAGSAYGPGGVSATRAQGALTFGMRGGGAYELQNALIGGSSALGVPGFGAAVSPAGFGGTYQDAVGQVRVLQARQAALMGGGAGGAYIPPEIANIRNRQQGQRTRQQEIEDRERLIAGQRSVFQNIAGGLLDADESGAFELTSEQAAALQEAGITLDLVGEGESRSFLDAFRARSSSTGGNFYSGIYGAIGEKTGILGGARGNNTYRLNWENFAGEGMGADTAMSVLAAAGISSPETAAALVGGKMENYGGFMDRGIMGMREAIAGTDMQMSESDFRAMSPESLMQQARSFGFQGATYSGYDQNLGVFTIVVQAPDGTDQSFDIPLARNVSPS